LSSALPGTFHASFLLGVEHRLPFGPCEQWARVE